MLTLDEIFSVEPGTWINALPEYQKKIINNLYLSQNDYTSVAVTWLSASLSNTVPFGTEPKNSIFFDKVSDEVEAFLKGDERYKECRLAVLKESGAVQTYAVGALSVLLAPVLGSSAAFLAPVIAIIFVTVSKFGINAWINMREEKRRNQATGENGEQGRMPEANP